MPSTSSLYSLSSCSPILRHYIQDCPVQKVMVHAGVLLSSATALSSPRSPDVVLGERVLRMLISCPVCHRIALTRSVFVFGTTENTPNIIRPRCTMKIVNFHYTHTHMHVKSIQIHDELMNKINLKSIHKNIKFYAST